MIPRFKDGRDAFFQHRLGMFVHWGLYCMGGWHEQELWRKGTPRREYEQLMHRFNPTAFDPDAWIDAAEAAGMNFICFTTKHHDGFCMWDTKYTDYNIMNTPYGRDILRELSDACQRRGMTLALYYSIPDWHHPNYNNQGRHHQMGGYRAGDEPDEEKYFTYVKNQVEELLTQYGPIYELFWDVNVDEWFEPEFNEQVRRWQPGIVINDRGPGPGDFVTPERTIPEGKEFNVPTQGCSSFGRDSWGYRIDEDYYTDRFLLATIDKILAMGGNYLLNVGPKPDGTLPEENLATLSVIGDWYRHVKEALDGAHPASYLIEDDYMGGGTGVVPGAVRDRIWTTRRGNSVYVHLPEAPQSIGLVLKPLQKKPKRAVLLNDGRELETRVDVTPWHWKEPAWLRLVNLPANEMAGTVMVIRLDFDEEDFA